MCIRDRAGVDTSSITKDCTFTVDPYSYEITVDGVDEETKVLMQNALNAVSYTHLVAFLERLVRIQKLTNGWRE